MKRRSPIILAPLAFGNADDLQDKSVNMMRDDIEKVLPKISVLDPIHPSGRFVCRSVSTRIGSLRLAAHSHPPVAVERDDNPNSLSLMLPFSGHVEYRVAGQKHVARAGHTAVFLTGAARTVQTGILSEVMIPLDGVRLMDTATSMLGPDHKQIH